MRIRAMLVATSLTWMCVSCVGSLDRELADEVPDRAVEPPTGTLPPAVGPDGQPVVRQPNPGEPVTEPAPAMVRFSCAPDALPDEDAPLRRLSKEQLRHTLRALLPAPHREAIWSSVATRFAELPNDRASEAQGSLRRLDQTVSGAHVGAFYRLGVELGQELVAEEERLEALMGPCAVDDDPGNDSACLDAFVRDFGARALRHPLSTEEFEFFRSVAYIDGDRIEALGVGELVAILLNAPSLHYHVERNGEPQDGHPDVFTLSAHELANRLSYHFWQAPPDAQLRAAADDGSLLQDEVYRRELARIVDDARTQTSIDSFVLDWLHLTTFPALDGTSGDPKFDRFYGEDAPDGELSEAMVDELLAFVRYQIWESSGSFEDLMRDEFSFAQHPTLASIYGVSRWQPGEAPVVTPASHRRGGLLGRAALLANASVGTHPIVRGTFLRREFLCDTLPDPPADLGEFPVIEPGTSARDRADAITMREGSQCAGCHQYINALGYAWEHFDALGRYRETEEVLGDDGSVLATHPVDASGRPQILFGSEASYSDAPELLDAMLASGKPQACMARRYFRFAMGRFENLERDGCALEALRLRLAEGASLKEMLIEVALRPEFRQRHRGELQ